MLALLTLCLAALAVATPAFKIPSVRHLATRIEGPMMWTGEVVSGEPTTLYGHAHSIYDEITSLNPLYNASALQMGVARSVTASSLAKRDLISCYSQYDPAKYGGNDLAFNSAAQILQLMGGTCHAGPGACVELECQAWSGRSGGVVVCNPNPTQELFMDCALFGKYTTAILDNCAPVQYIAPSGTKYSLHDGMYSVNGVFEMYIQSCTTPSL